MTSFVLLIFSVVNGCQFADHCAMNNYIRRRRLTQHWSVCYTKSRFGFDGRPFCAILDTRTKSPGNTMHRGHFETEYWNPEILQTQTAIRQRCEEFVTRGRKWKQTNPLLWISWRPINVHSRNSDANLWLRLVIKIKIIKNTQVNAWNKADICAVLLWLAWTIPFQPF